MNLIDNAIKNTLVSGVSVHNIGIRNYLIHVEDTGTGIPEEARSYIFERFYRADKARVRVTDPDGGGAGLAFQSRVDRGTTWRKHYSRKSDSKGSTFAISFLQPAMTSPRISSKMQGLIPAYFGT
jgi:two-component system sensor histidine kinase ResE